ncbi:hypothetical protein MMC24_004899 [Lignoscripta atroalba]|nr:hypothetical protein [Lignoscripta atroalba]
MSNLQSTSQKKATSYGRGGAGTSVFALLRGPSREALVNCILIGNMSSAQDSVSPEALVTPAIKSDHYTTGRGGRGNIAMNDPANPQLARESQDITALPRKLSQGVTHFGRGGVANTVKPTAEELAIAKEENMKIEEQARER